MKTSVAIFLWILSGVVSAEVFTKKQMVEQLKVSSNKMRMVQSLVEDARAKSQQVNAMRSPQLTFASQEFLGRVNQIEFGFGDTGSLGFFTFGSTDIQALYSVYDPTQSLKIRAADFYAKSVENQAAHFANELTFQCFALYIQSQKLEKKMSSLNLTLEKDKELIEIAKSKLKSGLGLQIDVMRANNLKLADELKKLDVVVTLMKTKNDLKNVLVSMDENLAFEDLKFVPIQKKESEKKDWQEKKSDLRHLRFQADAASSMKESLEREWLPKLSFIGNIGFSGSHVYGGFGNAVTGMIGVRLSMPLFTGGLNDGRLAEQSVKWAQATASLQQAELEEQNQLKLSKEYLKEALIAVETAKKNFAATEEEMRLVRAKFKLGGANWFEYAGSNKNYLSAVDLEIEAIANYELAKLQYYRSIGDLDGYIRQEFEAQ